MFSSLDISTSALVAQRQRLNAISSNVANVSTTHNEAGERIPYQPRYTVFQTDDQLQGPGGAVGVKVSSVEIAAVEPNWKYQPDHPDAQPSGPHAGYVAYPNVDLVFEFVDALEATRAYEANIVAAEATKTMMAQVLRLLA